MTPEEISAKIVTTGHAWAELEQGASLLEESRKSVRSQIAAEHLRDGCPVSKAEMLAEASAVYREHLAAMVEARKKANIARVNYDGCRVWSDHIRGQEATKRTEIQHLRG